MSRSDYPQRAKHGSAATPRRIALDIITDVTERGAYANLRIKDAVRGLSAQDTAFTAALCYGTLEHLYYLDYIIDGFVKGRQKPVVRNLLRIGCCELLFLDTPSHAAIFETVSLCRAMGMNGLTGFVNAVLRRVDQARNSLPALPEDTMQRLSIQYSCPHWLVALWTKELGLPDTEKLLAAASPGLTIRAQFPCTTDELADALPCPVRRGALDDNALLLGRGFDLASHPAFSQGRMAIQSEGAMLLCRALGDCREKRVLDACAAPGGKSAYIASLSENRALLTCFEKHAHRIALMQKNFERLHVTADILLKDASEHDREFDAAFDAVLLDVPCSGLGLLHEKPDVRYSKRESDIESLAATQHDILSACASYVRPGGILVYATCTISKQENEMQVERFLKEHAEYSPDPLPFAFHSGHMLQLLPHRNGTDGFFVARMKRCI